MALGTSAGILGIVGRLFTADKHVGADFIQNIGKYP